MLKIIGGTYRGRQLKTLPKEDLSIRPMLGMMKKSVFDIISITSFSFFFELNSASCNRSPNSEGDCIFYIYNYLFFWVFVLIFFLILLYIFNYFLFVYFLIIF